MDKKITPEMIKEYEELAKQYNVDPEKVPNIEVPKKHSLKENYNKFYEDKAVNEIVGEDVRDTSITDKLQSGAALVADLAGANVGNGFAKMLLPKLGAIARNSKAIKMLKSFKTPAEGVTYENPEAFNKTVDELIDLLGEFQQTKFINKAEIPVEIGSKVLGFLLPSTGLNKIKEAEVTRAKKRLLNNIYPDANVSKMNSAELDKFIEDNREEIVSKLN